LGDYFFLALLLFVVGVGVFEMLRAPKKKYSIWLYIISFGFASFLAFWPLLKSLFDSLMFTLGKTDAGVLLQDWRIHDTFIAHLSTANSLEGLAIPFSAIVIGILLLFFVVVLDPGFEVRDACFVFTMVLLISIGAQGFLYLRFIPVSEYHLDHTLSYFNTYDNLFSSMLFFYALIGTFFTDIGAYFIGVFFGKHKMNPRISPKKTWEGFFGGSLCGTVVGTVFFNTIINPSLSLFAVILMTLCLSVVGQLGDLVFSSIKRHYGQKDFSNLIPGHGGILDRLDSTIFVVLGFLLFMVIL
jgi:phosphatidate cytidylyltransferase